MCTFSVLLHELGYVFHEGFKVDFWIFLILVCGSFFILVKVSCKKLGTGTYPSNLRGEKFYREKKNMCKAHCLHKYINKANANKLK